MTIDNYWKKVIFSDKTQVILGKDRKVYIWRKDNEKWLPTCLGEHGDPNPHVRASVMFWGCITYDGVGTLVPVDGNINSQKYVDILEDNLWPVVAKGFANSPWIFQDDNATHHGSRYTMQCKQRNQIPTMMWPAQSPDINIIENVWRKMKILLQQRVHDIHSREDLIETVIDIWSVFIPAYIKLNHCMSLYQPEFAMYFEPMDTSPSINTKGQADSFYRVQFSFKNYVTDLKSCSWQPFCGITFGSWVYEKH